jgi:hypothetical protein
MIVLSAGHDLHISSAGTAARAAVKASAAISEGCCLNSKLFMRAST